MPTCHLDANARLVELLEPLAVGDDFLPTPLGDVRIVSARKPCSRTPQIYEPSLMVIAQGSKIAYLGERTLEYGAGDYLVQALPVPFEYETFASAEAPLLGVAIAIDRVMLSELVLAMDPERQLPAQAQTTQSMVSAPLDAAMRGAVERLIECMIDPLERQVMAQARLRDVLFAALRGPQGEVLRALVDQDGQFARIAGALTHLHRHFDQPHPVDQLAHMANMSPSTFHEHFKRCTELSPLQYLKRLRLLKARQLLAGGAQGVAQVARAVGYESSSQFSREYRRWHGVTPSGQGGAAERT